jgi:hypothetical protein
MRRFIVTLAALLGAALSTTPALAAVTLPVPEPSPYPSFVAADCPGYPPGDTDGCYYGDSNTVFFSPQLESAERTMTIEHEKAHAYDHEDMTPLQRNEWRVAARLSLRRGWTDGCVRNALNLTCDQASPYNELFADSYAYCATGMVDMPEPYGTWTPRELRPVCELFDEWAANGVPVHSVFRCKIKRQIEPRSNIYRVVGASRAC